ncbi:MAG TPA: substrate-binding domain-containing protein [Crocinitomicaceae bacterium]|nr:substrate-binding domain-containing protein [Crocinitomicaceae bacterium]
MKKNSLYLAFSCGLLLFNSCTNSKTYQEEVAPMYIDESFKPLFETSIPTFESQISDGKIEPHYVSELEAIQAFSDNKTKTICITREFTQTEIENFRKKNVEFTMDYVGNDALALIVHPTAKDSAFTLDELKAIFSGKTTEWASTKKKMTIVFDQSNSANFYYMYNLIDKQQISPNITAVKSNEEVIEIVRKDPNAMGVIGANWINDERDTTMLKFKDGIKVCDIAKNQYAEYFRPYAAYIYGDIYPLTRKFYIINKASNTSVNSQFVRFMTNPQKGQLIIYRSNLIPAKMMQREIQVVVEK